MALVDLELTTPVAPLPGDVRAFLSEADRRIERFRFDCRVPAFVPSDYVRAYESLRAVVEEDLAAGNLFCEWGSGFGVVACLAAMLDFDSCGIEVEPELVAAARQLAADFDLPVAFVHGSFIPEGHEVSLDLGSGFAWLTTDGARMPEELGLDPADFDVIFAFPWPDEEEVIADLFERHAAVGAVLATYHEGEGIRLRRKVRRRR